MGEQLSPSLSPSLSQSPTMRDRETESEKGLFSVESSNQVMSIQSNVKRIKLNESGKQNPMGSGGPLESQVGSVGQPDMLYKSSISHSGCGIRYHKSTSSVVIKKSNQMNYKEKK